MQSKIHTIVRHVDGIENKLDTIAITDNAHQVLLGTIDTDNHAIKKLLKLLVMLFPKTKRQITVALKRSRHATAKDTRTNIHIKV